MGGGSAFGGNPPIRSRWCAQYFVTVVPQHIRGGTLSISSPSFLNTFALVRSVFRHRRSSTTIRFELTARTPVRLTVYDVLGREMAVLANETLESGVYETRFEPKGLASGVYLYRLVTEKSVAKRKMVFVK